MFKRLFFFLFSLSVSAAHTEETASLNTEKISEAIGHMIGENLHQLGLKIDLQAVVKGLQDEAAGKASPLNEDQCLQGISALQEESFSFIAEKNLQEAAQFLKKNKEEEGIVSLDEGQIQYRILKEGQGESIQPYNAPLVRYSGRYLNGQYFAETQDEVISLEDAIPGFSKGIIGMKKGETRTLYVHPDQGYGKQSANSLLIFEVEVVKTDALSEARAAANCEIVPTPSKQVEKGESLSTQ